MTVASDSLQQIVLKKGELLAIVMFTRYERRYLFGREFTIGTNHGSLTWLFRSKNLVGQLDGVTKASDMLMLMEYHAFHSSWKCVTVTLPVRMCVPCPVPSSNETHQFL